MRRIRSSTSKMRLVDVRKWVFLIKIGWKTLKNIFHFNITNEIFGPFRIIWWKTNFDSLESFPFSLWHNNKGFNMNHFDQLVPFPTSKNEKYDILAYELNGYFNLWRSCTTNTLEALDTVSLAWYVSCAITSKIQ